MHYFFLSSFQKTFFERNWVFATNSEFTSPFTFATIHISNYKFCYRSKSLIYTIRLQQYRNWKVWSCGKNSISLSHWEIYHFGTSNWVYLTVSSIFMNAAKPIFHLANNIPDNNNNNNKQRSMEFTVLYTIFFLTSWNVRWYPLNDKNLIKKKNIFKPMSPLQVTQEFPQKSSANMASYS